MKYFKSYWNERTGDPLSNDWGTSWWYFETNDELEVLRQLTLFGNGQVLKYDNDYLDDKFGGLAEQPLEQTGEMLAIERPEFEKVWTEHYYKQFPEIVITEDTLWGMPRLEKRRLAVGDIVSIVNINEGVDVAVNDYKLSIQQARQALHYCSILQCVKDKPVKFCHNCTLRVQQDGEADGEEKDNWKIADNLLRKYFGFSS